MKKQIIITVIITLVFGVLLGAGGLYYIKFAVPLQKAKVIAQQQQEELDAMVRQGDIVEITPDTVKVNLGTEVISVRANEYTTVQVGMTTKNATGQKTDLKKYFNVGDSVNLLVREDQVLAIYRSQRPDEIK